jgi:hypothetical protein
VLLHDVPQRVGAIDRHRVRILAAGQQLVALVTTDAQLLGEVVRLTHGVIGAHGG